MDFQLLLNFSKKMFDICIACNNNIEFQQDIVSKINEIPEGLDRSKNARVKTFDYSDIDVPLNKLQYLEVLCGEPFYELEHVKFIERICEEADCEEEYKALKKKALNL